MNKYSISILLIFICFFQCAKKEEKTISSEENDASKSKVETENKLFEFLTPSETNITFQNSINETDTFNMLLYEYLYNGGGVALGDINNDGLLDIYFSGNTVSNRLYLNKGDFKFEDISESAGVSGGQGFKTGVNMTDVNNDGLLDIYVCKSAIADASYRQNMLYINNGDLTFTESAQQLGLNDSGFSVQAYFFDMDGDKDLDVYVLNHPSDMREANSIKVTQNDKGELEVAKPKNFEHIADRLYENKGGKFVDISEKAGVLDIAFGLSAVIADFNNDFLPDIYVCNDYIKPDRLLLNTGNNTFEDHIYDYFNHTSFSSMGSDYADINNDEHPDLITLDMSPRDNYRRKMLMMAQNYDKFEKMKLFDYGAQYSVNALQLNSGTGFYTDVAFLDNLAQTDWSWSALMADFDNNGLKDIHITNGYKRDVTNNDYARYDMDILQKKFNAKEITLKDWIENIPSVPVSSFLFKNEGQVTFKDASKTWNSGPPAFSNGSAYGDLDNDGYLDLVVSNINDHPFIMKNTGANSTNNNYLSIKFEPIPNETQLGTKAKLYLSNGTVQTEVLYPTRGFLSSSQHRLHFGFSNDLTIDKLEIIWPDRNMQTFENPIPNQIMNVVKNPNGKFKESSKPKTLLTDVSDKLPKNMRHEENTYIDFKREVLLHHKISVEGPGLAVGDVNGDGLDDIYVGGASGFAAKLFVQDNKGRFNANEILDFEKDKDHEDVSALLFDANGDGSLDLYVVSGGSEFDSNSSLYQDRLYINNGKGNFKRDHKAIPKISSSGSVVKANDIDGDGQMDLFVGGRVVPGRYPEAPKSYLLKNNNGVYTDVTLEWSKDLQKIGMITDAAFNDIDNDGVNELILCGEWMPISVFKFEESIFKNKTHDYGLDSKIGWWNSLTVEDLNNDGYADIIGGNLGLNSFLKASTKEPLELYYKDFDRNGSLDAILCSYIDGVSYPVDGRDRLLNQMVMLKKRFTRYDPYARATVNDIFTSEELKDVKVLKANHLSHTLYTNEKGKGFMAKELPRNVQTSVLQSCSALDINNDGNMDVVSGGNFYETDAEFGRYDASIGDVILNKGDNNLEVVPAYKSGFKIPGHVCQILPINIGDKSHLLIARNNDKFSLFKIND
ncbi:VCBS repeat-containing protein [Hanstruepera flava]|uniref:VCBS repeat-containing protein n=1 Tax=Hanstruepera flava TaxID=2930218 RepID=UPI002028FAE9|nr:VCBS repeat-containing protein [Hanstruepera flava]